MAPLLVSHSPQIPGDKMSSRIRRVFQSTRNFTQLVWFFSLSVCVSFYWTFRQPLLLDTFYGTHKPYRWFHHWHVFRGYMREMERVVFLYQTAAREGLLRESFNCNPFAHQIRFLESLWDASSVRPIEPPEAQSKRSTKLPKIPVGKTPNEIVQRLSKDNLGQKLYRFLSERGEKGASLADLLTAIEVSDDDFHPFLNAMLMRGDIQQGYALSGHPVCVRKLDLYYLPLFYEGAVWEDVSQEGTPALRNATVHSDEVVVNN